MIVAGAQKGVGSSREQAAQCEVFSGSRLAIASSFAPIHARNNINIGQLMGDHAMIARLEAGERISLDEFTRGHDPITALIIESGGLLPFCARLAKKEISVPAPGTAPRPMNITEKILAAKLLPGQGTHVKPGDAVLVRVDAGYSHEFTTAQVDKFLTDEYGDYKLQNPTKFAVFEDHLVYATGVASMAKFADKIERLRVLQRAFAEKTGVRNYTAKGGVSPGICHQVAREEFIDPGDLVQATDSHTCMGGASGALAWGVGATEYAALLYWGFTPLAVPESIRFELTGKLPPGTSGEGRDAPHPRDVRQARGDAQPRDGVRRRRPVRDVARRARDAREHGDRVLGARRGHGSRRHDAALDRRARGRCDDPTMLRDKVVLARSRRALRRRRAPIDLVGDPADGRDAGRSGSRHRKRSEERRARQRDRPA